MKHLFIFLFITCHTNLSIGQIEVKIPHGPRKERNLKDYQGRKQGQWKVYSYFGELIRTTEYVDGRKEGLTTTYYKEGESSIREEMNYFDNKKDGEYKKNFYSGETEIEGEYNMGHKDGKWTYYHNNGEIKRECSFKKGVKDGEWKSFNKKGELIKETTYKDGVDMNAAKEAPKVVAPAEKGKPGAKPGAKPAPKPAGTPEKPANATPPPSGEKPIGD